MDAKDETRIVYHGGITRRTSDFLCEDGELAECINMTSDGEEMKVLPHPEAKVTGLNGRLLYVHRHNGQERYIVLTTANTVRWGTTDANNVYQQATVLVPEVVDGEDVIPEHYDPVDLFTVEGDVKVTSIGKTLIFTTSEGLKYATWKEEGYFIFDKIPELKFKAWMRQSNDFGHAVQSSGEGPDLIDWDHNTVEDGQQEKYNDLVIGLYSQNLKKVQQKKGFCQPFFVRAALRLVDNSYTMPTSPILLYPAVHQNSFFFHLGDTFYCNTYFCYLNCSQETDYTPYADIVKDVVVFVSDGVSLYDTTVVKQPITALGANSPVADMICLSSGISQFCEVPQPSRSDNTTLYRMLAARDTTEIADDIKSESLFYEIFEIGTSPVTNLQAKEHIKTHTLENLTTQTRLQHDDYYSHCPLTAEMIYAYNSRLNIAGIHRGFFPGFDFFMPFDDSSESTYVAFVRIKTDSGTKIVRNEYTTAQKQGFWFYYPDPRASHVTIYTVSGDTHTCVLDEKLTEHSGLNGAYYFKGLPTSNADASTAGTATEDTIDFDTTPTTDPEYLPNQIATSKVNNPFVFNSEGYNTVGNGRILAMSTQTQALSQGQFGQYPLLVFTDEGIWAMGVDKNTGLFNDIQPMPREVCINPNAICQTDDAVLFISKKGLMAITGREVACVSLALDGRPYVASTENADYWASILSAAEDADTFQSFLCAGSLCSGGADAPTLMMAYDYIDARILLFNSQKDYCWVYSMKDGGFTKLTLQAKIVNVVNNYPDYLLQEEAVVDENAESRPGEQTHEDIDAPFNDDEPSQPLEPIVDDEPTGDDEPTEEEEPAPELTSRLLTLYGKTREEDITARQTGFLLTRPIKLSAPLTVSSIRELVDVGYWNKAEGSIIKTAVLVSDDLFTWHPVSSRFGAAAKYFRIALYVNLLPSERLSGTIIRYQDRRTNNLRP